MYAYLYGTTLCVHVYRTGLLECKIYDRMAWECTGTGWGQETAPMCAGCVQKTACECTGTGWVHDPACECMGTGWGQETASVCAGTGWVHDPAGECMGTIWGLETACECVDRDRDRVDAEMVGI